MPSSHSILLIVSKNDKEIFDLERFRRNEVCSVFLCPLDRQADAYAAEWIKLAGNAGIEVKTLDFLSRFNAEAFTQKESFVNLIHALGEQEIGQGANVKDYFRYPGKDFSVWWFSSIAEKNPYQSKTFLYFVQVLTILKLKKENNCQRIEYANIPEPLRSVLSEPGQEHVQSFQKGYSIWPYIFLRVLIEPLRVFKFIAELTLKIISTRRLKRNSDEDTIRRSDFALLTMFPHLNEKELQSGKFANTAYGSLQNALREKEDLHTVWFGIYAPVKSYKWKHAVEMAEKVKTIEPFFLIEEFLSYRDMLSIVRIYLTLSMKLLLRLKGFVKMFYFRDDVSGINLNLWSIFRDDFISSFMGKVLIWRISDFINFSNIVGMLPPAEKVVYFAELHGWERTLNAACAGKREIRTIGLQHASLPLLWLNYFIHPNEIGGRDYVKFSPLPDYLGCVGTVARDIFLQNGWPKERIFIVGGFRFSELKPAVKLLNPPVKKRDQILIAFSLSPMANRELLGLIFNAFSRKDVSFDVLLKCHPLDPLEDKVKKWGMDFSKTRVRFTEMPLHEIVPACKAMVVKESSSVFWAVQNRIPVIVPYLYNALDLNPLSGVSDLPIYVRNSDELFSAASSVITSNFRPGVLAEREIKYRNLFSSYLNLYEDDMQYLYNIENALSKNFKPTNTDVQYAAV